MRLDAEMVIRIHDRIIAETGGSPGLENPSLLLSALGQPWQTFAGKDLYDTVWKKAAALCRSIACNHPFVPVQRLQPPVRAGSSMVTNGRP